jgi:hypothetical protein
VVGSGLFIKRVRGVTVFDEGKERKRIFGPAGRDNPLKRLIFGQARPRKSRHFLEKFGWSLDWLGSVLINLELGLRHTEKIR